MGPAGSATQAPQSPNSGKRPETFSDWLLGSARTEQGRVPNWAYVCDYAAALEDGTSGSTLLVLKRRQILISWVTAAYWHYMASRYPYRHGAVISAGKISSAKQGRRILSVARADGYDVRGAEVIRYPSGSEITIFPSTEHAGVGESLALGVHFDEFDFHPYGRQNLATVTPAVTNSGGQTVITSTANPEMGTNGPFAEMWLDPEVDARRLFLGRWVRPDQPPEAEFWERERKRPGMSAVVMRSFYPETQQEAFSAPTGLVYPQFGEPHKRHNDPVPWGACIARYVGYDLGGGDPTAQLAVGVYRDRDHWPRAHVYGEYYRTSGAPSAQELFTWQSGWHERGRLASIEADSAPGGAVVAESIRALFDRHLQIRVEQSARYHGLNIVAQFLEEEWLTVNVDECPNLVREFGSYRWLHRVDPNSKDRYATATPHDHHGDALDSLRRTLVRVFRDLWNQQGERQPVAVSL